MLMCAWTQEEQPECGDPSNTIVLIGAGTIPVNGTYNFNAGDGNWYQVADPTIFIRLELGLWKINYNGDDVYWTSAHDFPCGPWFAFPSGQEPPPTGSFFNGPDCGTPSNFIQVTGAGDAAANQVYEWNGIQYGGLTDSNWSIGQDLSSVWHIYHTLASHYTAVSFPCTWAIINGDLGAGPAPSGRWILSDCGSPTATIQISGGGGAIGGGSLNVNQDYSETIPGVLWTGILDLNYTIEFSAGAWKIFDNTEGQVCLYASGPITTGIFPCTWELCTSGVNPLPTGKYI